MNKNTNEAHVPTVQDFPQLPYPGVRPATSYVIDCNKKVLPVEPDERMADQWNVVTPDGPVNLDTWLVSQGAPTLFERQALLSYGSNANPEKAVENGTALPIVNLRCSVDGLAAVMCAGVRSRGDRPATLMKAEGHSEQHFVSFVTTEDLKSLDGVEGRRGVYSLQHLTAGRVALENGETLTSVLAYVGANDRRVPHVNDGHAAALLGGGLLPFDASEVGVSLREGCHTPDFVRRLFVYGTLMPGEERWVMLEGASGALLPATTVGSLYDSGNGYPALDENGTSEVPGYVVEIDEDAAQKVMDVLDVAEGVRTGLYRRSLRVIGGTPTWVYYAADKSLLRTPIEKWPTD